MVSLPSVHCVCLRGAFLNFQALLLPTPRARLLNPPTIPLTHPPTRPPTQPLRRYYGGVLSAAGELLSRLEAEQGALGAVDAEPLLQRLMLRATLEGLYEVGGRGLKRGGELGLRVGVRRALVFNSLYCGIPLRHPLQVPDATALPGFDELASNILLLMAEANAQVG